MKGIFFSVLLFFVSAIWAGEGFKAEILVTDFDEVPIQEITVKFYSDKGDFLGEGETDFDGRFKIDLEPGSFVMKLYKSDELIKESPLTIPELEGRKVYNNVRIQILYEERNSFEIEDLHFESGSAAIQETSFAVLDRLATFLNSEANSKFEIAGHTDADGSATSNLELSKNRAEAVKQYLISKGVAAERLVAKGYGEAKPIAGNDSEAGKAENRRTELIRL